MPTRRNTPQGLPNIHLALIRLWSDPDIRAGTKGDMSAFHDSVQEHHVNRVDFSFSRMSTLTL